MSKGKSLDDPARAQAANAEARKVREELWAAAHAECAQMLLATERAARFALSMPNVRTISLLAIARRFNGLADLFR